MSDRPAAATSAVDPSTGGLNSRWRAAAAVLLWGAIPSAAWAQGDGRLHRGSAGVSHWLAAAGPPPRDLLAQLSWQDGLDLVQVAVAAGLWLALLLQLPRTLGLARAALRDAGPGVWPLVLWAVGMGAGLRFLLPPQLVMVYKGYELTQAAADFVSVPRYGAGSLVAHRAVMALVAPSHDAIVGLHTVAAVLALLLLPACLAQGLRGYSGARFAVPAAAAAIALMPLAIVDARSESILVLGVMTMAIAWLRLGAALAHGAEGEAAGDIVAVIVALGLAATIRPELIVLGPLLALTPLVARQGSDAQATLSKRWAFLAAAGLCALALPSLLHLQRMTAEQVATGALPPLNPALLLRAIGVMAGGSALFRIDLYPVGWLVGCLGLLTLPAGPRRLGLWLLAVSVLATGLYAIDLPDVSLPRLHAPAALLVTLVAALGAVGLWLASAQAGKSRLGDALTAPAARRGIAALCVALAVASALPSARARLQTLDESEEDALVRTLLAALPPKPVCIARLDPGDTPAQARVHRDFPDYLFQPPHRRDRLMALAELDDKRTCDETFVVLGVRCYLDDGRSGDARPIAACRDARALAMSRGAQVIAQREVVLRGSDGFGWLGAATRPARLEALTLHQPRHPSADLP